MSVNPRLHALVRTFPTLGQQFRSPQIHLFDHFFFHRVPREMHEEAAELSRRIAEVSRGRKTRILSANSEVVGKTGEFVVEQYFQQRETPGNWKSFVREVNQRGGDQTDLVMQPGSLNVDIKTRQLYTDQTIAPSFDLRVPHTESDRHGEKQDVYLLAGFCPATSFGYVFGWCTRSELLACEVREDIKFPARCVPLTQLHPIQELARYAQLRAEILAEA